MLTLTRSPLVAIFFLTLSPMLRQIFFFKSTQSLAQAKHGIFFNAYYLFKDGSPLEQIAPHLFKTSAF